MGQGWGVAVEGKDYKVTWYHRQLNVQREGRSGAKGVGLITARTTGDKRSQEGDTLDIGREGRRRESSDMNINEMRSSQMVRIGDEFPRQLQKGPGAESRALRGGDMGEAED